MRLVFLAGRDPRHPLAGGGDEQAWRWAAWCAGQGHEVFYVCQSAAGLAESELVESVAVLRLGRGPKLALRAGLWIKRGGPFDLIYEDPIGAGRVPYLSPLYAGVPVVAVWHQVSGQLLEAMHNRLVARALSIVERLVATLYRRCLLWAPSDERAQEVAVALGFDPSRITVLPPTIDESLLVDFVSDRDSSTFLFLGVLRPYKNVHHILEALAVTTGGRLVIAGRSPDKGYCDWLRERVDRLGIADRVEFRFSISNDEKILLLDNSCALILPSELEGFGIVTIEAHARGLPVIASTGVPRAAVEDYQDGLRFATGDVGQLSEAMNRILMDRELTNRMGVQARASAEQYVTTNVAHRFDALVASATGG